MILLIDTGNSCIKWGIVDQDTWLAEGVLQHQQVAALTQIVGEHPDIRQAWCVNVAGERLADDIRAALRNIALEPTWLTASAQGCGVTNRYTEPAQLGADRWAALIGARAMHSGACLVVTAGTATTIDTLDAAGVFQGGLILPGIQLMRKSLADNTAQLPLGHGIYSVAPRNTADAIASGCLVAQIGAIEHIFRAIAAEPDALCLLSGGGAPALAEHLEIPCKYVKNLVLRGLSVIARNNTSPD